MGRVLFLGGPGRGGTTLVERVPGAMPGACPLGEVVHLWRRDVLRWALPAGQWMLVGALAAPRLDVYGYAPPGVAVVRLTAQTPIPLAEPVEIADAEPLPSVGVVVPTRDRPHLLRRALASILTQDYPGPMRVVVVFDRSEPDWSLSASGDRPVTVMPNWRSPGLAGCRNTGILAVGDCDLVAFCDDDDTWAPGKLTAQVTAMLSRSDAQFATCAIEVEYDGRRIPRLAGRDRIEVADLARSRMVMLHSSGFLAWHGALITDPSRGGIGLVAEDAPSSQNEDWDLLLRAARQAPIVHVDLPLVRVLWGRASYFDHEYATKVSSLHWMTERHPEISACPPGAVRVFGQIACWEAACGNRASAWRWARAALRSNWREPRALIAVVAAARVERVLAALHRRGRGI